MNRALLSIDNAYNISNIIVNGHLCHTNLASNTAFRGFGGPQSMLTIESIINNIYITLNKTPNEVSCYQLFQLCLKIIFNELLFCRFVVTISALMAILLRTECG